MISRRTNIVVPYTLENSDLQMHMSFCCELFKKTNTNSEAIYSLYEDSEHKKLKFYGYCLPDRNRVSYFEHTDTLFYHRIEPVYQKDVNSDWFINIFFPVEQIGTYIPRANLYHIDIYTYIKGRKICLFNDILDSYNNLACSYFLYNSIRYQEYQEIRIPNINQIIDDLYTEEKQEILKEFSNSISISIQPVQKINDSLYKALANTQSGNSIIPIIDNTNIHLENVLDTDNKVIRTTITFNTLISESLEDYISTMFNNGTEQVEPTIYLRYFLINKYDEVIYMDKSYKFIDKKVEDNVAEISFEDFLEPIKDKAEQMEHKLEDLWEEGLQIAVYLEVYSSSVDPEKIPEEEYYLGREIQVKSQPIAIIKDMWYNLISFNSIEEIIGIGKDTIKNKIMEMSNTYNVINTIEQQTIQVNQTGSYSGLVKPVFFRAYPIQEIVLHRDMKENICINLDEYKSKVDMFYLKLCGNYFSEYTRTFDGVVFNINSSVITSNTGSYYICDRDKNFITSGKYKCE